MSFSEYVSGGDVLKGESVEYFIRESLNLWPLKLAKNLQEARPNHHLHTPCRVTLLRPTSTLLTRHALATSSAKELL